LDAKLIFLIYTALQWAASPFILVYFVLRFLRDSQYLGRFSERLGFLPPAFRQHAAGAIWLHAVSVGEVLSSVTLLRRLKAELGTAPIFVSTSTLAGRVLADERLAGLADGVFYAPLDFRFAVRRVLRALRPAVVVVAETEIWPHLYRESKRTGCGLLVVNGRISEDAWPSYRRWTWFFRRVLSLPDLILAQSAISRERYIALGAPPECVIDSGNLKYDFQPRDAAIPAEISDFLELARPDSVWIAASTMPPAGVGDIDEDDAVIEAFGQLSNAHPSLLLILVPRKPERFDVVAAKLQAKGIRFVRRSQLPVKGEFGGLPGVLLLDSIGELAGLFRLDSVVFMGGSLANRGGHNILEPAFFERPVVVGPHMENFPEIIASFREGGACREIADPSELGPAVDRLLRDPSARLALGEQARRVADAKRGATDRAVRAIADLREEALPRRVAPAGIHALLWLLARLWQAGSAWKQARSRAHSVRLSTPVVSIGGLSMGGSGKTPFVLWLAEKLRDAGGQPGILTRGYRRSVPEKRTILEAGATEQVARTGDEAQILLRSGVAPLGIGADRFAAGTALEERFHPDVMLLDDGFQHGRLHRDLDVVLVDSLDPFGGGDVFPLGRLREGPQALARADVFVITRAERGRSYAGIEEELRKHNRRAPILRAWVVPEVWVDYESGDRFPPAGLPYSKVAAFCALANPASFWGTLAALGYHPVGQRNLADHHRYRPWEVQRLAAEVRAKGAEALLTTEKDIMNMCDQAGSLVTPARLLWLKIGLEVEGAELLLDLVKQATVGSRLERQ
jgi:3-deoxy-D-manno-octulosonic-acid transferase